MSADVTLPLQPTSASPADLLVHRYRLGDLIGRGGCGQVHRARDLHLDRDVAIKFISPSTESARRQLRRELTALRLLSLPGVMPLLDDGEDAGQVFLVMPLLEGGRFDRLAEAGSWESWRDRAVELLHIVSQVHRAGVVHLDLKPENILLDDDRRPVVTDFGLALGRAISVGERTVAEGTPRYMSPEQRRGEGGDERSDLYALGVLFCEMIGDDAVPDAVYEMLLCMTSPLPSHRPSSAAEVAVAFGGAPSRTLRLPEVASQAELRALFVEPKVTFVHAADDAVSVLWQRTEGRRARVQGEVERWLRAGRVHWRDGGLHIDRTSADALLRDQQGGVADLVARGRSAQDDGRSMALVLARQAQADGAYGHAMALLAPFARTPEDDVAITLVECALAAQQRQQLAHVMYLAQRHGWVCSLALLKAATIALFEDPRRGLDELLAIHLPAQADLQGWRLALAVHAALRVAKPMVVELFAASDAWADGRPERVGRVASWRARAAYSRGAFADALSHDLAALSLAASPFQRLARLCNAAASAMEVPDLRLAAELAADALALSSGLRHAAGEVRATWLHREITYRVGDERTAPQPELVHAAHAVSPVLSAQLAIVEGARAWRAGRNAEAAALGQAAEQTFLRISLVDGVVLARVLQRLAGVDVELLADDVQTCHATIAAQAVAACARAGVPLHVAVDVQPLRGRMLNLLHGDEVATWLADD